MLRNLSKTTQKIEDVAPRTTMSADEIVEAFESMRDEQEANRIYQETRQQVIALKEVIEQHGLTPSLLAFADFGGSLTSSVENLTTGTALESLSEKESADQKARVLATLESFLTETDEISTEGFQEFLATKKKWIAATGALLAGIAAVGAGPVAGVVVGIIALNVTANAVKLDEYLNKNNSYGSAEDAEKALADAEHALTTLKKIIDIKIPMAGDEASVNQFKSKMDALNSTLAQHGLHVKNATVLTSEHKSGFKMIKGAIAGVTIPKLKDIAQKYKSIWTEFNNTIKVMEHRTNEYINIFGRAKNGADTTCMRQYYLIMSHVESEAYYRLREVSRFLKIFHKFLDWGEKRELKNARSDDSHKSA